MRACPRTSASAETDQRSISMPGTSLTQFHFVQCNLGAIVVPTQRIYVIELRVNHSRGTDPNPNPNPGRGEIWNEIETLWQNAELSISFDVIAWAAKVRTFVRIYMYIYIQMKVHSDRRLLSWLLGSAVANCRRSMLYLCWIWAFLLNHFSACSRSFHLPALIGHLVRHFCAISSSAIGWSTKRHIPFVQKREWRTTNLLLKFALWQIDQICCQEIGTKLFAFLYLFGLCNGQMELLPSRHLKIGLKLFNYIW